MSDGNISTMIEALPGVSVEDRAVLHRALGDEGRLRLVDCLVSTDRTPGELAELTGLSSNLLAFHLGVLEEAGLVERRRSEGDSRRRYVHLRTEVLQAVTVNSRVRAAGVVVFVCTHNSARSQVAEALWRARTGGEVWSVGSEPADQVHPRAVEVARRYGVDLAGMRPKGYGAVPSTPDLIISVCDRALEAGIPMRGQRIHWSVPDPVGRGPEAFDSALAEIAHRVDLLASDLK